MIFTSHEGIVDSVIEQDELGPHRQATRPTFHAPHHAGACLNEVDFATQAKWVAFPSYMGDLVQCGGGTAQTTFAQFG
jgi:hypothetical protein